MRFKNLDCLGGFWELLLSKWHKLNITTVSYARLTRSKNLVQEIKSFIYNMLINARHNHKKQFELGNDSPWTKLSCRRYCLSCDLEIKYELKSRRNTILLRKCVLWWILVFMKFENWVRGGQIGDYRDCLVDVNGDDTSPNRKWFGNV